VGSCRTQRRNPKPERNHTNMKERIANCFVRIEAGIVGFNDEMADMTNPSGAIYRDIAVVVAEAADGTRWVHGKHAPAPEVAERLAARVKAAGWINPLFWNESYPVYGSAAYRRNQADEVLAERRADEEACWR